MYIGLDVESVPLLTNENIQSYLNEKKEKILEDSRTKSSTKTMKIMKLEESIMLLKSTGEVNEELGSLIKDFSTSPTKNKICGIGLCTDTFKSAYAGEDEKELLENFINDLSQLGTDPKFTGHKLEFDINSIRIALIRNNLVEKIKSKIQLSERGLIFPLNRYDPVYLDTLNIFPKEKLNNLANSILGESKIDNGSEVYNMYKNKEFDRIKEYVQSDAWISYRISKELEI